MPKDVINVNIEPKYHPGDVPERVLGAARTLLERMPAADISVRELPREAAVSHAAPYRHFGDRSGLVIARTSPKRCGVPPTVWPGS